jgi:hypothetical protein
MVLLMLNKDGKYILIILIHYGFGKIIFIQKLLITMETIAMF